MIDYIFLVIAICGLLFPTILYPIVIRNKINNHKFPTSYSGTYKILYNFSKKTKLHLEHIFTAWTGIQSVLLVPALVYYSNNYFQICVGMFSLISLVFVGLFPTSVSKEITTLHCIFVKFCALLAVVWLLSMGIYYTTLFLLVGGFIWAKIWQEKYETMIMEFMSFASAYIGVIICCIG